ncbi:hypothetical protein MELA_01283, partial [Candidatus Methylomirabilis lanthanidiphila]
MAYSVAHLIQSLKPPPLRGREDPVEASLFHLKLLNKRILLPIPHLKFRYD